MMNARRGYVRLHNFSPDFVRFGEPISFRGEGEGGKGGIRRASLSGDVDKKNLKEKKVEK